MPIRAAMTIQPWACVWKTQAARRWDMTKVTDPTSRSDLRPTRSITPIARIVITRLVRPTITDCIRALVLSAPAMRKMSAV